MVYTPINGDDLGMVYYCFTHITNILMVYTTHKNGDDFGMFILSLTTLLHMVVLQLLKWFTHRLLYWIGFVVDRWYIMIHLSSWS